MTRIVDFLLYTFYAVGIAGGVGVVGGVVYGCYVMFKQSVLSGLLILVTSALGASLLYIVLVALIAVATFVTDSGRDEIGQEALQPRQQ